MPRLLQPQFEQALKTRPQGVTEEAFIKDLLKSGAITKEDLVDWNDRNAKWAALPANQPKTTISHSDWLRMTRTDTPAQKDARAAELMAKGAAIEGYRPPEERERRYNESVKRGQQPSIWHPVARWNWQTPNEKQQTLDNTGEFIGGTAGAIAAGTASGGNPVISALGAGGGATAGKALAHGAGRLAGIDSDIYLDPKDLLATFGINATGELVGGGIFSAIRTLRPTARAAAVAQLWDKMGIPMTLARRSGNETLQAVESALQQVPIVGGIVRKANRRSYEAVEAYIEQRLKGIHPSAVSREELAEIERTAMERGRNAFSQYMEGELTKVARQRHPAAQTARSAGEALKAGQAANQASLKQFGDANYPRLIKEGQDYAIQADDLASLMTEWQNVPPQVKQLMPQKVRGVFAKLDAGLNADGALKVDVPGGQMPIPMITAGDALEMKRELNGIIRGVADAKDRAVLGRVRDALQGGIDSAPPAWADEVNRVNALYGETARKVSQERGGKSANGAFQNNPMARKIAGSREPEGLANGLIGPDKGSQIELVDDATNRYSVQPVDPKASYGRPLDAVGAHAVEQLGQESKAATGRVSPNFINKRLLTPGWEPTYETLLGGPIYGNLKSVANPWNISKEEMLHKGPLAAAVDSPIDRGDNVFRAMFPAKSTSRQIADNMSLLTQPEMSAVRRGFADDLLTNSRSRPGSNRQVRATGLGTEDLLDAGKMEGQLNKYGDTVDHVLGPDAEPLRNTQTALSQMQEPVSLFGNSSGTAHANWMLHALGSGWKVAKASAVGPLAGGLALTKVMTNPTAAKNITRFAGSKLLPALRYGGGATARSFLDNNTAPKEQKPPEPEGAEAPPPIPGLDDAPPIPGTDDAPPVIPGLDPTNADEFLKKHKQ